MSRLQKFALSAFVVFYAILVLRTAWLCDDAYITFRTIDNFVHGYGLRWNIVERVQTYTHPLWLFALTGVYALTGEIYTTTIFFSFAVSLAAAALLIFGVGRSFAQATLAGGVIIFSKALVEYSTSGLENPLTHLLAAAFCFVFLVRDHSRKTMSLCSIIACLSAMNRLDTLLVYLPALGFLAAKQRSWKHAGALAAGFTPLILWELFSVVYYGFLFPNTAYAKLGHGRSSAEIIGLGLSYCLNSLKADPLTLCAISLGLVVGVISKRANQIVIACGIVLYLIYTILVGGDFMSGRFFTLPLILSLAVMISLHLNPPRAAWGAALATTIVLGLIPESAPLKTGSHYSAGKDTARWVDANGISDERRQYYAATGLLRATEGRRSVIEHEWGRLGSASRAHHVPLIVFTSIGFLGFNAGPQVHILDLLALGDPLLARLPSQLSMSARAGHFFRIVPEGYVETLRTGNPGFSDPNIAEFYRNIRLVTRGDIWRQERWSALWGIWTGKFVSQIDLNPYANPPSNYVPPALIHAGLDSLQSIPDGISGDLEANDLVLLASTNGVLVYLDEPSHARAMELAVSVGSEYPILFSLNGKPVGYSLVVPGTSGEEVATVRQEIGVSTSKAGFDRIWLISREKGKDHLLRFLKLVE